MDLPTQYAGGIEGLFLQAVAFGVEGVFDGVAEPVGQPYQAPGVVVSEAQGGRLRRTEATGNTRDFSAGQVGPAGHATAGAVAFA